MRGLLGPMMAMVWKDVLLELRSRDLVVSVVVFGLTIADAPIGSSIQIPAFLSATAFPVISAESPDISFNLSKKLLSI